VWLLLQADPNHLLGFEEMNATPVVTYYRPSEQFEINFIAHEGLQMHRHDRVFYAKAKKNSVSAATILHLSQ